MFQMTPFGNEKQVDELNQRIKVRIAPSPIHGVGVFAIRDILKGEKLHTGQLPIVYSLPYNHFNKLFPEVRDILLERWPRIVVGAKFAYPDLNIQAYMNHSEDANYDNRTDLALRDIKKGEEILEDYRNIDGWQQVFPWLNPVDKKECGIIDECSPTPVSSAPQSTTPKTRTRITAPRAMKRGKPSPQR